MTILAEPSEVNISDLLSGQEIANRSRTNVPAHHDRTHIVGHSSALLNVVHQAEQVAATKAIVLILGETGTGKELLAQHMYRRSERSTEPFITTNIAAIPGTLLESELFGRERGAYTGAMNRQIGRFEVADGGTLFLDEVGEMPLETQVKLLRVLENGEFERLGSSRTLRVDVRVIAATNRSFSELLRAGSFRRDLFYRLSVFPLTMPPLRDRVEDIPALVWAFIKEFSYKMGKPIERVREANLLALQRYHWPGNVRELRNVVERSMILATGAELRLVIPDLDVSGESVPASRRLRDVEKAHIVQVLKSSGGRIRGQCGAAEILGLKPTTLYSLMRRLGIRRDA
jgi:formate hydrogenlyase transcriptional activator